VDEIMDTALKGQIEFAMIELNNMKMYYRKTSTEVLKEAFIVLKRYFVEQLAASQTE
jgi:hypothetical protein